MDEVTKNFIKLLSVRMKLERSENTLGPYKRILENISYVLPYTPEEIIEEFNKEYE